MLQHNSAGSPGFAYDVILKEAQLRLSSCAEHQVHLAWHLLLCRLHLTFLVLTSATIQVLNDSQHRGHLHNPPQIYALSLPLLYPLQPPFTVLCSCYG